MSQEAPKLPNVVDWEKIRETNEYKKHIVFSLRIKLQILVHPPDYWKRLTTPIEEPNQDDFETVEDWLDASNTASLITEEEQDIDDEIMELMTVEDIVRYVEKNNIPMNVAEEIRKLEETYLEDQAKIELLKQQHGPRLEAVAESMLGIKKNDDPQVN